MRSIILATLLLLSVTAFGSKTSVTTKAEVTAEMAARASDAVDSALQVLEDLRQANVDTQTASDESNQTQQTACDNEIADLHGIADTNKASGDASTAHRKFLESEIVNTIAYLQWTVDRRADIHARQEELQDQRCYASMIFVRALKEHSDSLHAIDLIKTDLIPSADRAEADEEEELIQVNSAVSKLQSYKHLFDEQALAAFNQLADSDDSSSSSSSDSSDDEVGAVSDNDQPQIKLLPYNGNDEHILGGELTRQIIDLLDRLARGLNDKISELEKGEVASAWSLAIFLQDSEAELIYLADQEVLKAAYLDKTRISVQAAKAGENKAWEIYFQSATAYNNAVLECIRKGQEYEAEKRQRTEETALLDDVINTFKESVSGLSSELRSGDIVRRQNTSF